MRFVLAVLALFASFGASAGVMYRGVCFVDTYSAARAAAGEMSTVEKVVYNANIGGVEYQFRGSMRMSCGGPTVEGHLLGKVICSPSLHGNYRAISAGPLPPPGAIEEPGVSIPVAETFFSRGLTIPFAACDGPYSDVDQVQAIMDLWPYALALLATAWGSVFLRRLLNTWASTRVGSVE